MSQAGRIGALAALSRLPAWRAAADREALVRVFQFPSFAAAMAFIQKVAGTAEAMDHHPDWRNVYDKVEVVLFTHTAGGVTEKDVRLAQAMDAAAAALGVSSA